MVTASNILWSSSVFSLTNRDLKYALLIYACPLNYFSILSHYMQQLKSIFLKFYMIDQHQVNDHW